MSTKRSPARQPRLKAPPEAEAELRAALKEARDPRKLERLTPEQLEHMAKTGEWPESLD